MKLDKTMLFILAGVSLFLGYVVFSVGVGAIFPSLHKLSAPIICSGDVQLESVQYSYKPGQVGWERHIYCVNGSTRKEITFPAIGVTGLFASLLMFIILAIWMRKTLTVPANFGELATDLQREKRSASSITGKTGSAMERLSELKKMRDENLISDVEYQQKRTRIMDEL
ncbi:MAG: SHOCT domain-containing protein [Anaerolineales bacterium]